MPLAGKDATNLAGSGQTVRFQPSARLKCENQCITAITVAVS